MAVRRVLSNNNVTSMYETVGGLSVHHSCSLRCADAGHGGGVYALTVSFATDVFGFGTEPVQTDHVHMRRSRTHMFLFHSESREYTSTKHNNYYIILVIDNK